MAPDTVRWHKVWTLVCTSCCAGWPMTVDHGECKLCGGELELRGEFTVIDMKGTPMFEEARKAADLVERRTAQVRALANCDQETAGRMVKEFTEKVVSTNIYPFADYTPGSIVDWWKREHATEPRRW